MSALSIVCMFEPCSLDIAGASHTRFLDVRVGGAGHDWAGHGIKLLFTGSMQHQKAQVLYSIC